jgi:hypothetical protein
MANKNRKTTQGGYNTLRNRLGHFIVGGILVIAGPILLFYAWQSGKDGRASETWPTAKGKITEAEFWDSQSVLGQHFEAKVRYTFVVDGKTYTGDRIKVGGKATSNQADAKADMKRYGLDARTEVRYDPSDPSRCTLETGAGGGTIIAVVGPTILIVGLVLVVLGVIMTLLAMKKKDDTEQGDDEDEEDRPKAKKAKRKAAEEDEDETPPPKKKKRPSADEDEGEEPPRKRKSR